MPTDINSQINDRIQVFVAELSDLVRVASLEAVLAALGGDAPTKRRRAGRLRARGIRRIAAAPPKRAGRRLRRSSEDVDATAAKFLAFVKANDGKRLEEIGKALGMDTADLKLPAQKLLAAKAVRTTGAKRGTKYHVAGAGKVAAPKAWKRAKKA